MLKRFLASMICLPHARGGVSKSIDISSFKQRSSPRTWGCFPTGTRRRIHSQVFPTHVGVFPIYLALASCCSRLPHARGGVSTSNMKDLFLFVSSPRTWGCFCLKTWAGRYSGVFPTHVGVFLERNTYQLARCGLPHARGGVSA